jgi:hypothetical protein
LNAEIEKLRQEASDLKNSLCEWKLKHFRLQTTVQKWKSHCRLAQQKVKDEKKRAKREIFEY